MSRIETIERFILENQPEYAQGEFTYLLYDIALAAKLIAHKMKRAGLAEILGQAGNVNVQGEEQQKLDIYADELLFQLNDHTGRLCAMASEEREELISIPEPYQKGSYALVYDPLDGSSNIDVNVSIGTIFGIYRCLDWDKRGRLEDVLQKPKDLVAAGYVLYGSSTMFVYTTGDGVHGFTLDSDVGEFLLSHPNMRFPSPPKYYSVNESYYDEWTHGAQSYYHWLQGRKEKNLSVNPTKLSSRYIGSLVADFHRNLLSGGVFAYPAEADKPEGKIRLLYEAGPLAFMAEQAGGYASDGKRPIADIQPEDLHQRVPLYIGNRDLVRMAEAFLRND